MSRAAAIRAWLLTQDGPRTGPEIRAALGGDPKVGFTVGSMYRDGLLGSTGERRNARYFIAREPEPAKRFTEDEIRQRKAAREEVRRRKQGCMTMEQLRERRAVLRAAKLAAAKERAAEKRKAKAAARAAAKRAQKRRAAPKAKPKAPARPKPARFDTRPVAPDRPAPVAVQSVEDWMAAGNQPEVLKPFAWSRPLRTAP